MKRAVIILAVILNMSVFAHIRDSFHGQIVSQEHDFVTNPFTVSLKLWFVDTTRIDDVEVDLPQNWSAILNTNIANPYLPGDSTVISFSVSLPNISELS